ncbi:MAG: pentapeptide repeat-containing protein [Myxococcota bacterium]
MPLWHFRICSVSARDLDLSFGDGALSVWHGRVFDSLFRDFKFDGASSFIESEFNGCDFGGARLRLDGVDTVFSDCDFSDATFAGGLSEYGFTRCSFVRCRFRGARWKRTYLKACRFECCELEDFWVENSVVPSVKHRDCTGDIGQVFANAKLIDLSSDA